MGHEGHIQVHQSRSASLAYRLHWQHMRGHKNIYWYVLHATSSVD